MTTTSRDLVISFLRRHNAVEVLEGAPLVSPGRVDPFYALRLSDINEDSPLTLYLGSGPICPAAIGWAARVLAVARDLGEVVYLSTGEDRLRAFNDQDFKRWHEWRWTEKTRAQGEVGHFTHLPGPTPPTPAERLKAVIKYEVGR